MVGHVTACTAGNIARLFQSDVGIGTDRETVLLAVQPILQPPELRRGFSDLAGRRYLQIEVRYFAVGVLAGFGQRADEGVAEFSFENDCMF